ncbi:TonB-dependent receptor [Aquimarina longa]|uniref:TonB-dependent receptor n=1 Tax=Aquimarina longa TaxID=1080221 RepID=UPI000785A3F4|nr:carboxypeptidase-like regulatory domain-containing protein [Aquimarina longa]
MRVFLVIILFLNVYWVSAQKDTKRITITFDNVTIEEALHQIEAITSFRFYYVRAWLDDVPLISGTYTDVLVTTIVEQLLKRSILNYYVLTEKEIVLTRNTIIYDKLPDHFFNRSKEVVKDSTIAINPLFYLGNETSKKKIIIKTYRIGKEVKKDRKEYYTLTGYVKYLRTGKPISNVALIVKGKNIGAETNAKGFYSIELPVGLNYIETSSLGVEDSRQRVIIYNDGQLDLYLSESLEALEEVLIKTNADKNVKEVTTGTEEIDVEESKNIPLVLGERDVLKVATTLPGITTSGEGASGYNVRGGKADQNLTLLDDGVIYNPQHFFGIFSALNPFAVGSVNIYKGSIPAEYGGRLSSVFNLKTKNGNTEKFSGEASIGPVTGNIAIEIPVIKNKSSLMIGGRGTYSDWILKSLDEEKLKNSKASFYDLIAKYHYKINDDNNIQATGYYSSDVFSVTSDSLFNYSNRLLSLKWNHRFNDKNSGSLLLTNSKYNFGIKYEGKSNNDFELGYDINETELKLKMNYLYSSKYKFNYGFSSKLYEVHPGSIKPKGAKSITESLAIPKERALESAVFVEGKFDISKKLSFNLGIRYSLYAVLGESEQRIYDNPKSESTIKETLSFDTNEVVKTYQSPEIRASGRYLLASDLSIKAGYNNSFQYIHTLTNNTTASPTDIWKVSDINIKPQQASLYSLGVFKNLKDDIYELSIEGYYKKIKNILDYKVGSQLLLNKTVETEVLQGLGKAYGVEFLIKKNKGKLNGWLGYTYSRSFTKLDSKFSEERVNGGDYFPSNFDKPHDISLVANYKFTKRFSFSTNFVYQTGRPVTFPVGSYILQREKYVLYSDRNEFRIPDYYRLDIGFNIEGNHKKKKKAHSFWSISVYNVLGRNNPFSVFFVTEEGEIKAYQSSVFSIPIPTITYNFKF